MPRIKFLKPYSGKKKCPKCGRAGGSIYCRNCHGPRRKPTEEDYQLILKIKEDA